ncbi:MAG TPA: AbrB/MazE/SpoVT family DNA-binding domain-containing protein [Armatimonadota bacterium]|nr:AbrB/MazE/SpoVT family DNA-binding domain-containing protein [Armatimonadota bacterium]HQK92783.1 AbrB/MazE/SpoVT family DNA-binding domain-containing protein [Armatimonadota bacterium]
MTSTVDSKGRVTIPAALRKALKIREGDTVFIDAQGETLRMAKAESPFDALAAAAIAEHRAGKTRSLREYAKSRGIDLDA